MEIWGLEKLALVVRVLPSGVSPGNFGEKALLAESRASVPLLRDAANRLRKERKTLRACTGGSSR